MAYGVIYRITCKLDGKPYVGQTVRTLEERFQEHTQADSYIGNAIRAHGVENFTCEVIEECDTREQLNEREIFWIAELNCKAPNGYNLTDGGEGGIPCDEVRAKLSALNSGENNPNYGKHPSDETRAKMSAAHSGEKNHFFGKQHTDETKAKLGILASMRRGEKNPFFGKQHTDETCVKLSIERRGESHYKNLLAEMDARQITYHGLAKILGLTQPNISEKMCGKKNFTESQIAKLVEIFEKPADYLLERDDGLPNKLSTFHKTLYKNLLAEMDARQITYRGLAKILGLAQPTISQKMRGKYNFTAEQIAKLVEIFDKPAEYLMAHD